MAPLSLPARTAVFADAAALVVFAVVGLASHGHAAHDLPRVVVPFVGCWLAAGAATRLYRRPSWRRLVATWALGVPAGWLVRALVLGRTIDGGEAAFLGVALAFTLAFVLAARSLAGFAAGRRMTRPAGR